MHKWLFAIISILVLVRGGCSLASEITPEDIEQSVVLVTFPNGYGSGVMISDTLLLSAYHVYEDGGKNIPVVFLNDGSRIEDNDIQVKDYPDYDIVVYSFKNSLNRPFYPEVSCKEQTISTNIQTVGSPIQTPFVHSWGKVATRVLKDEKFFVQVLNAAAGQGMSGGPVFNNKGQLIGILVAYLSHIHTPGLDPGIGAFSVMVPMSKLCLHIPILKEVSENK